MSELQKVSKITQHILNEVVANFNNRGVKTNRKQLIDDLVYKEYGKQYTGAIK